MRCRRPKARLVSSVIFEGQDTRAGELTAEKEEPQEAIILCSLILCQVQDVSRGMIAPEHSSVEDGVIRNRGAVDACGWRNMWWWA
jgi:hypothetical protein